MVAPHPRADRDALRQLCPDGWEIWAGRTYELLQAGPPVLIQASSGVALEALLLGVPTIDVSFPGALPPYPLIREPHVHVASSSSELEAALAEARLDGSDPDRRARIVEWAKGWSHPSGEEAAGGVAGVLRSALSEGPRGPIWDTWTPA